jgi:hypothetical protein
VPIELNSIAKHRKGAYRVSMGRPERKRHLGRPRRIRENNIKMGLQEVGWEAWTGLIWLRVEQVTGSCKCGYEISFSIKREDFLGYLRTC